MPLGETPYTKFPPHQNTWTLFFQVTLDPTIYTRSFLHSSNTPNQTKVHQKYSPKNKGKMSQCVPNWDLDDTVPSRFDVLRPRPRPATSTSSGPDVPMLNYEMAELTWENGQLSMHGLGLRRVSSKSNLKYAWDRPRAGAGTLESIVNLATQKPPTPPSSDKADLVPSYGGAAAAPGPPPATVAKDALVPSETAVDSCSGAATCEPTKDGDEGSVLKRPSLAPRVPVAGEWNKEQSVSVSVSGTMGADSWHVPTVDTWEKELGGFGLTSTSFCSQGNTFSSSGRPGTTTNDDHDSVCHSRPQRETGNEEERKRNAKSSSSTRRSRAAAIHNQSERKRRDKINQKMKMLQKLVPNSNKTDKASMLDEVIDYLKQLQAQVHMMNRMSVPSMMMPAQLAMQQQLQMSMMAAAAAAATAPMGMGMGMAPVPAMDMNLNMNINPMAARQSPMAAFIPVAAPWDVAPDARLPSQVVVPTDPISTYLACQPQPMTIEAYSRMIALIQQQQQLASVSKH